MKKKDNRQQNRNAQLYSNRETTSEALYICTRNENCNDNDTKWQTAMNQQMKTKNGIAHRLYKMKPCEQAVQRHQAQRK